MPNAPATAVAGTRLPFVQYVASLAVLQAVQAEARSRLQGGCINLRIKWPNDLYIDELKVNAANHPSWYSAHGPLTHQRLCRSFPLSCVRLTQGVRVCRWVACYVSLLTGTSGFALWLASA